MHYKLYNKQFEIIKEKLKKFSLSFKGVELSTEQALEIMDELDLMKNHVILPACHRDLSSEDVNKEAKSKVIDHVNKQNSNEESEIGFLTQELQDTKTNYDCLLSDYAKNKVKLLDLQYKERDLLKENKIMRDALEHMQSGFGGMFGHQTVDPRDEAWEMCPKIIDRALKKVKTQDNTSKGKYEENDGTVHFYNDNGDKIGFASGKHLELEAAIINYLKDKGRI